MCFFSTELSKDSVKYAANAQQITIGWLSKLVNVYRMNNFYNCNVFVLLSHFLYINEPVFFVKLKCVRKKSLKGNYL